MVNKLRLDVGTNSIGWCWFVYDLNGWIFDLKMGVRIFPEGLAVNNKNGDVSSKASERRKFRGQRRGYRRTSNRKKRLASLLISLGLLNPKDLEESTFNPYALRAKGLDEPLNKTDIGLVFYHLIRRGFLSNRKGGLNTKEEGEVKKAIGELDTLIAESDCRTVGEYFHKCQGSDVDYRVRNRYLSRKQIRDEFELLYDTQAAYYPDVLTSELRGKIAEAIFFQRPLRPQMRGPCAIYPQEYRAHTSCWEAQHFRTLKDICNNLRREDRDLTVLECLKALDILSTGSVEDNSVTYANLKKGLGFPKSVLFRGEPLSEKDGRRDSVKKNTIECAARAAFKDWGVKPLSFKADIREAVYQSYVLGSVSPVRAVQAKYQFPDECLVPLEEHQAPNNPMDTSEYSVRALQEMIVLIEGGMDPNLAERSLLEKKQATEEKVVHDFLLPFKQETRNPAVNKTMGEVVRVVNALIRAYGKPDEIVVEVAKELQVGIEKRNLLNMRNKTNEKAWDEVRRVANKELGLVNPSREDLVKIRLWKDQGGACPYCGSAVALASVFSGAVQVDHIHPYSRTNDDSFGNKVLACTTCNQTKADMTPWEWLGDAGVAVIERALAKNKLMRGKLARIKAKVIREGFTPNKLSDTQYISKLVVKHLQCLGVPVLAVKGGHTALLRKALHAWPRIVGKDKKDRTDHRHHAIDAFVLGFVTPSVVKRLYQEAPIDDLVPANVWDMARTAFEEIVVSHKEQHKVPGSMHKDTAHRKHVDQDGATYYTKRVKLDANFDSKWLDKIEDSQVQAIVRAHWESKGCPGKITNETFADLRMKAKPGRVGPPIKGVGIRVRIGKMLEIGSGPYQRYFENDANSHMEVFKTPPTGKNQKVDFVCRVVSAYEARRRILQKKPVVDQVWGENQFMYTLYKGDTFQYDGRLYVVTGISDGPNITAKLLTNAGKAEKPTGKPFDFQIRSKEILSQVQKVRVDPIGKITSRT